MSDEIKERTYDLKCLEQGRMIQVLIPASVPLREFDYKAEDIILKNKNFQPAGNLQPPKKG